MRICKKAENPTGQRQKPVAQKGRGFFGSALLKQSCFLLKGVLKFFFFVYNVQTGRLPSRAAAGGGAETCRFGKVGGFAAHCARGKPAGLHIADEKSCLHFSKPCLHELSKNTQNFSKKILTFEIRCDIIVKPLIMGFET